MIFTSKYIKITAWQVSKYGVASGSYFSVFGLNTGKYGPEITPYLDTFHEELVEDKGRSPENKTLTS